MEERRKLLDAYLPPQEPGFALESLVATTYNVQWDFVEEELVALALGVKAPTSRLRAFRSELERKLASCEVSILFDPRGCEHAARASPRIDAIPTDPRRKQHSKITLMSFVRSARSGGVERRLRLVVGSANLTRQGFRENYEVACSFDFGGKAGAARSLLEAAIQLVRQIAAPVQTEQLTRQLDAFASAAAALPDSPSQVPTRLVAAENVVLELRRAWDELNASRGAVPQTLTIVSPFWSAGENSARAVVDIAQDLGSPAKVELVCCGESAVDGKRLLPVMPAALVAGLRELMPGRVAIRPARPIEPAERAQAEDGEEPSEDDELAAARPKVRAQDGDGRNRRPLHAKIMALSGQAGAVVYVGSSNCTRRGLARSAPGNPNWEAGLIFQFRGSQAQAVDSLWSFAAEAIELASLNASGVIEPDPIKEVAFPTFIADIVADGQANVTISFRPGSRPPACRITTLDAREADRVYILFEGPLPQQDSITVGLASCRSRRLDGEFTPHTAAKLENMGTTAIVEWDALTSVFPVRFDNKAALPPTPWSRQPTEWELIQYFLTGRQPWASDEESGETVAPDTQLPSACEQGIDTSGILSYQMRTFVDALFGMEDTVSESTRSRGALHHTLFGQTSPLSLGRHAVRGLTSGSRARPVKTAASVGFQLVEIKSVIQRCKKPGMEPELLAELDAAAGECDALLAQVAAEHAELRRAPFTSYKRAVGGIDR